MLRTSANGDFQDFCGVAFLLAILIGLYKLIEWIFGTTVAHWSILFAAVVTICELIRVYRQRRRSFSE